MNRQIFGFNSFKNGIICFEFENEKLSSVQVIRNAKLFITYYGIKTSSNVSISKFSTPDEQNKKS